MVTLAIRCADMGRLKFKFGGVNNVLDSAELNRREDRFSPYTEMVQGTDIDISDRMAVRRRPGREAVSLTVGHSLWSPEGHELAYFVSSSGLWSLSPAYTETLIALLTSDAPMAYVDVNNAFVYSNGVDIGVLVNAVASSRPATSKVGRIPLRPGVCLAFYNSRVYSASPDGVLYYTDPHDVDYMTEDNCRIPLGGIGTMVQAVDNGLWVSTHKKLTFLDGDDAMTFSWRDHGEYYAIPGASMRVSTKKLRGLNLPGKWCAIWASVKGVCIGTANGELINLSEDRYSYAPGNRGAIMLRETEGLVHIVVSLQSAGTNYNQDSTTIAPARLVLN